MPMSDTTVAILSILAALVLTIGASVIVGGVIASRFNDRISVPGEVKMFAALCIVLAAMNWWTAWITLT